MKAMFFSGALLLSSFLSFAGGETDEPSRYPVDVTTSSVTWVGTKVTGSHNGDIQINNGMLTIEDGMISAATVIIDMGTINTLDLQAGGGKESLDGHLMSDDFFGVEQFPTAQFELTQLNPLRGGENGANFSAQGKVTIKGRSENVSFPVTVEMSSEGARISGDITLDRSKFDVQFRSQSFFDAKALGDKLIYDEFTIGFELVAGK
jgi:polyisoprenoid-binding protein YceI